MERTNLGPSMDPEMQRVINFIFDNSDGNPIILDSDPTTIGKELMPNQIGFNPTTGKLFRTIESVTYLIATLTPV